MTTQAQMCPLCGQVGSPPNCTGCDPEITRAAEVGETQIENELFRVQCRILELGTDKSLSARQLRERLMALRTEIIEARGQTREHA